MDGWLLLIALWIGFLCWFLTHRIELYTLHSIIMVLLYYIYLIRNIPLATVINFISPFSQFDAYIHKLLDIDIWFLATKRKLRKSPAFQFLVLAVNHFVLMAILNTCNISIKYLQWYVYLVCYIYCIYSR